MKKWGLKVLNTFFALAETSGGIGGGILDNHVDLATVNLVADAVEGHLQTLDVEIADKAIDIRHVLDDGNPDWLVLRPGGPTCTKWEARGQKAASGQTSRLHQFSPSLHRSSTSIGSEQKTSTFLEALMESGGAQAPGERSGRLRLRLRSVRPPARLSLPILTGRRGNRVTGAYPVRDAMSRYRREHTRSMPFYVPPAGQRAPDNPCAYGMPPLQWCSLPDCRLAGPTGRATCFRAAGMRRLRRTLRDARPGSLRLFQPCHDRQLRQRARHRPHGPGRARAGRPQRPADGTGGGGRSDPGIYPRKPTGSTARGVRPARTTGRNWRMSRRRSRR